MERQMKGMPQDQQDMIISAVEQNPELFEKISKEIKQKTKEEGKDQQAAAFEVMRNHQSELQKVMGQK